MLPIRLNNAEVSTINGIPYILVKLDDPMTSKDIKDKYGNKPVRVPHITDRCFLVGNPIFFGERSLYDTFLLPQASFIDSTSPKTSYQYKDKNYEIIYQSKIKLDENWEDVVIYKCLYDNPDGKIWVRFKEDFFEKFISSIENINK